MNWTKQNIFCDILHNFQETDVKREIFSSLIPIKYSCAEDSVMKCFVSMIAAPTSPTSSISPQHRDTAQPGGFVLPIYSQYNSFYRNNMDTRGAAAWPEQTSVCLSWLLGILGINDKWQNEHPFYVLQKEEYLDQFVLWITLMFT